MDLFGLTGFEFEKEEIKVTNLGKRLAECCELENLPEPWKLDLYLKESNQFLHALTKYQVNNPFKRVLNEVNPLIVIKNNKITK